MYYLTWLLPLLGILCCTGYAQDQATVNIKAQPDAPLQVISAECRMIASKGPACRADVQVSANGRWTGFGLKWTLVRDDGKKCTMRESVDADPRPGPEGGSFREGEIVGSKNGDGGVGFTKLGSNSGIQSVEVELEFAVPLVGETWGNTQTMAYVQMMALREGRRQARTTLLSVYANEGLEGLLKTLNTDPIDAPRMQIAANENIEGASAAGPIMAQGAYNSMFRRMRLVYSREGANGLLKALGIAQEPQPSSLQVSTAHRP